MNRVIATAILASSSLLSAGEKPVDSYWIS